MVLPHKAIDGYFCLSPAFYLRIFDELRFCSSEELGPLPNE